MLHLYVDFVTLYCRLKLKKYFMNFINTRTPHCNIRWVHLLHSHTRAAKDPHSTTSICRGFVGQQVVQQAVQHLHMLG